MAKGGSIPEDSTDLILIGTTRELELCPKNTTQLPAEGKNLRVLVPFDELFEKKGASYREGLLPAAILLSWNFLKL